MSSLLVVLASTSPRRRDLLQRAGYDFVVKGSSVEELDARHHNASEIVIRNATLKGSDVASSLSVEQDRLIDIDGQVLPIADRYVLLAADTLVVKGQRVYGKPIDMNQAFQFIRELGGERHRVLTGVYLIDILSRHQRSFLETTEVTLRSMTDREIGALFDKVNPLDKAGAYGFQDSPEIVSELVGSKTNVYGLPMKRLNQELKLLLTQN